MSDESDYTMAPVRASTRVSIAWSGGPPEEDTDTLVLTIDGYSIDLRVFTSGPDVGKVDWASVGLVREVEGEEGMIGLAWEHLIDSRGSTGDGDAGSFSTLPNGDVLETGSMHNPKTDKIEPFEEVWRRHPRQPGLPHCVLERVEGDTKAYLGRIGPRALGLAQDGKTWRAFRDELTGNEWKRLYEFAPDPSVLPRLDVVQPTWTVGQQTSVGGVSWTVRAAGHLV